MRAETNSWLVGVEVMLEPTRGEQLPALMVRMTATQGLPGRPTGGRRDLLIRGPSLPGYSWQTDALSASAAIFAYLDVVRREPDSRFTSEQLAGIYDNFLEEMRVPVFGSPPRDWHTLATAITSGTITSGAVASAGAGNHVVVLSGLAVTLFMNIAVPVTRGLGQGFEYRIGRMLGVPAAQLQEAAAAAVADTTALSPEAAEAVGVGGGDEEEEEEEE